MKQLGQGLVEYALILVIIAVVVIGVMTALGRDEDGCPYGYALSRTEQICIKGVKPDRGYDR